MALDILKLAEKSKFQGALKEVNFIFSVNPLQNTFEAILQNSLVNSLALLLSY